ncbi:PASTA domain-containing protein [Actinomadura fibrosa]|uniref:PASTA domain-containing protein n=1 Tax=Actinomadura fibrosa TaxID=111802 RepID=A0ABW2XEH1_9ACTN|nr:hypothetical protein [Actinomadura fibrosa]
MRITAALGMLVILGTAACGATPTAAPVKTVTATPSAAAVEPSTAPSTPPSATAKAPAAKKIKVPNVVGHNHQAAQNEMQAVGLYMLAEKDATGQGRLLLWDRNWVVVKQSPEAGRRVTEQTTITLYSKKIGE